MREFIKMSACPFRVNDRVKDDVHSGESTVYRIEEEHVYCETDEGKVFYRTWTHGLDTVMRRSGGGLTRIGRPEDGKPNS